jgi:hypothetical protein
MSKSSGGGFGIGTLLMLLFVWNVFFDNDEDVAEKVIVKESDNPEIQEKIKEVKNHVKEAAEIAAELAREKFKKQKQKLEEHNKTDIEETEPEIVDEKPKEEEGMKKL